MDSLIRVPIGTPASDVGKVFNKLHRFPSDLVNKIISNGEESWQAISCIINFPHDKGGNWEFRELPLVKAAEEVCYVCGSTELVMPHVLSNSGGRKINLCKGCLP